MLSQKQTETAAQLAKFVVENGRVAGSTEAERMESLRNEVEFECDDRGLEDCTEIAEEAAKFYRP